MFELPEYVTLARQVNETLAGKTISTGSLGSSPHKFVWYNRKPEEFAVLTAGKRIGAATTKGKWLFVPLEPGYILTFGDCGGRLLYHETAATLPPKYHLWLDFDDGAGLTAMTQQWGAMELYEAGKEQERFYIKGMRTTPVEPGFSFDYFSGLIDEVLSGEKRSVKGLLTQDALVPGIGNAIAQDVMFAARLHPRHPIADLTAAQRRSLYDAIVNTVQDAIAKGGRYDEVDLYNRPGGYVRVMDKQAAGQPCPVCGTLIRKEAYLGGSIYFCPHCQI